MSVNTFGELRDHNGDLTQIIMTPQLTSLEFIEELRNGIPEDSICVTGKVQLKVPKAGEEHLKRWELIVEKFQVLNKSNETASQLDKLKHSNPDSLPPHLRYLQLRTPKLQDALRKRSRAANVVRQTLIENHNFVEIETPLLFKSTPEGAREFLVPTRTPNKFYALPQSPQQYKQILMLSGFTRYFQIAKCFRDEDLRADRQPEFTQIDLEMSFISDSDQVGAVVEDVVKNIWEKVADKPIYRPLGDDLLEEVKKTDKTSLLSFPKISYIDAMTKYGIDKPDLRSTIKFVELSKIFKSNDSRFPIVEACVLKNALSDGAKIPHSFKDNSKYPGRKPIVLGISTEELKTSWFEKFIEKGVLQFQEGASQGQLAELLNVEVGDILAFSTREEFPYENPTSLGRFRQLAIEEYPNQWCRKIKNISDGTITEVEDTSALFVASWVVDFPLFNPPEDEGSERLQSTHHPFTMVKLEDYKLLESDPLKARGEHYDLVINGVEVGGGSRRVHDPELQMYILKLLLKIENHEELFGHLIQALSMGCPPHAGLALGFDRLCSMLIGSNSIRDVIAFPKNQAGADPMVESPTPVPDDVLGNYHIKLKEHEESTKN